MATITDKGNSIEFVLSNETHLIQKSNLKAVRLDEYVAFVDSANRQQDVKRFVIKYSEVENESFANGGQFYSWIASVIGSKTPLESTADLIKDQTEYLIESRDLLVEVVRYLKKIYSQE